MHVQQLLGQTHLIIYGENTFNSSTRRNTFNSTVGGGEGGEDDEEEEVKRHRKI